MGARGLVERIGGPDRLREILDRFYQRLSQDILVGFFFHGQDLDEIAAGQQAFLMWAFGAEPELRAEHPKDAHGKIPPILSGHFDRRLVVLRELLLEEGLRRDDIAAWLKVERSMRKHVLRPHPDGTR